MGAKIKKSDSDFKDFKGFWVDKNVNKAFMMKCIELEVNQKDILENLIVRWLEMKSKQQQRKIEIYGS